MFAYHDLILSRSAPRLGQTALTWASEYGLEEVLALLLGMAFDQPAHVQQVTGSWETSELMRDPLQVL